MPPRSLWSGAISFGLVNIPVKLYSAVHEHDLRFHYVHEKDGSRIGYEKICKKEGKKVPEDEIVKAYQWSDTEYVPMEDSDFEAAAATDQGKTIDLLDFVDHGEIDPVYFERTYHLGPAEGAEKVYALLARALEESGLSAIGTFVMRNRQHLGCLRVHDRVLTLEKMYFHDEIRPLDDIVPDRRPRVEKKQLDMALKLIADSKTAFDPTAYEDTYSDALREIVKRKRKGQTIEAPDTPEQPSETPDLMDLLQQSLDASRKKGGRTRGHGGGGGSSSKASSRSGGNARKKKPARTS